jgi:hypothetical protein
MVQAALPSANPPPAMRNAAAYDGLRRTRAVNDAASALAATAAVIQSISPGINQRADQKQCQPGGHLADDLMRQRDVVELGACSAPEEQCRPDGEIAVQITHAASTRRPDQADELRRVVATALVMSGPDSQHASLRVDGTRATTQASL